MTSVLLSSYQASFEKSPYAIKVSVRQLNWNYIYMYSKHSKLSNALSHTILAQFFAFYAVVS